MVTNEDQLLIDHSYRKNKTILHSILYHKEIFTFSRINFRINIKTPTDIIPANAGEANHEPAEK